MAGLMKDFFDRCYYPALGRIEGRPYAVMVCAGSDGSGAARQIERICTGWRLKAVAPALIVMHAGADARGHPGAEAHRCRAAAALPRTRRGHGRGAGARRVLT